MLPRQFTAGLSVCLSLLRSRAEPKLQAWCVFIIKPERSTSVTPPGLFLQQQWTQSCWFMAPIQGGRGETAENADHSRLADDSVNKQGTYLQDLSGCKVSRFPRRALPASPGIWKLYIEFSMGFSHMFHPKGLNSPLLSQGYETAPSVGIVSRMYISRIGRVWGAWVNWQSCPLHDLLQKNWKFFEVCLSLLHPLMETFPTQFHFLSFCRCLGHLWTPYTIETANCLRPSFSLWLKLIHTNVLTP